MKQCQIGPDKICVVCRRKAFAVNTQRNCFAGLGDIVAAGLSAAGITKERVAVAAKMVGVEDCGCSKRQQQLNELGRKLGIGADAESS